MRLEYHSLPGEGGALLWPLTAYVPVGFRVAFATRVVLTPGTPRFVNYGFDGIPGATAARRSLCKMLDIPFEGLTVGKQMHSSAVIRVDAESAGTGNDTPNTKMPISDGLATSLTGVTLGVTTADCIPILLAEPNTKAIASVHAGWRGILAGIIENTVSLMKTDLGADPANIFAYLGPSIGPCCYEVKDDTISRLSESDKLFLERRAGAVFFDLRAWSTGRLRKSGIDSQKIWNADVCTCCHTELFFSHRGDKTCKGLNFSMITRLE